MSLSKSNCFSLIYVDLSLIICQVTISWIDVRQMKFHIDDEFDIHPSVYIASSARIYGKVKIGANTSIWDGVVIRGDMAPIEIGENTSIQENAVVHVDFETPTFIGNYVTVGHGAIIHSAKIGNHCIIAIQSTVLNNAVVENYSVIGAGAVVMEGDTIPSGSIAFGIPAKVIKQVNPEIKKQIRNNAEVYVALGNAYKEKFAKYLE